MTLAFFKYGLPILLGYTLFVGISGRLNPFLRPQILQERASWYLGIWIGLAVSCALAFGLHLAYTLSVDSARALLLSSASLIACLVAPALGLYAYYQYRSKTTDSINTRTNFDWAMNESDLRETSLFDTELSSEQTMDSTIMPGAENDEGASIVSPAYLEAAHIDQLPAEVSGEAVNDSGEQDIPATKTETGTHTELKATLAAEIALRQETEKHLRITRKALSVLEADTRHHTIDKADALIELEEKLAQSIEAATAFERLAEQEKTNRIEIEHGVIELKQKMVKAKQQVRQSAAARAKALSTANKSIAFARQSVQIRARLESELTEAHISIDNRQKTMSSLIRALEKEKRKTQDEVTTIAKQLVLKEKQLKARRSLEGVARSVENKLTSRLVKKVAKGRPLISDMNQGEAS